MPGGANPIPGVEVSTHNAPICFDPSLWHCTLPFVGERWALTCYTLADVPPAILAGFNFPSATETSALQVSAMAASPEDLPASVVQAADSLAQVSSPPPVLGASVRPQFFLDICSGASAPLSEAAAQLGISSIPFDILRRTNDNLLDDTVYDGLLKLSLSGCIVFAHGSPPCSEYSLIKHLGPGPPPCRSFEHGQVCPTTVQKLRLGLNPATCLCVAQYPSCMLFINRAGTFVSNNLEIPSRGWSRLCNLSCWT